MQAAQVAERTVTTITPICPKSAGDEAPGPARPVSAMPRARRSTAEMRLAMQKAMQEDAAVFRTGETLDEGRRRASTRSTARSAISP